MKNMLLNGELQGIWMHGHAEEWRPAISRVVQWMKRGRDRSAGPVRTVRARQPRP
jgi:hypothetical protein